jgi:uncharacterized protein
MRLTIAILTLLLAPLSFAADQAKPLKALLITGGCCHDYENQKKILTEGISARANVEWTIVHEGVGQKKEGTNHRISIYEKDDWAKGYDVIVHNECFADVNDVEFVERVTKVHHEGVPGVVIHCTMHTFRSAKTDEWRKFLGVTSTSHEAGRPELVKNLKPTHPIMKGFPAEWKTPNGELYIISKLWPETTPLAQAFGQDTKKDHPVIWTSQYGKARVFGTTLGHHNETMGHEIYLNFISRGLLWACGKLDDNGNPKPGYAPK